METMDLIKSHTVEGSYADSLERADILFADQQYSQVYDLLKSLEWEHDPHVLWRLARCRHREILTRYDSRLVNEARSYANTAAALDPSIGDVCKWAAILFSPAQGESCINQLDHYTAMAMELDPTIDADTVALFGEAYINLHGAYCSNSDDHSRQRVEDRVIDMFEIADKAAKHITPKYRQKIANFLRNKNYYFPRPTNYKLKLRRVVTIYREIINKYRSYDDPAVKKIVSEALICLPDVYGATF